MKINAATKLTLATTLLTRSQRFFGRISDKLLPRIVAIVAIFALLVPTLFIIPILRVEAREAAPMVVASPPERFAVGLRQLSVSGLGTEISAAVSTAVLGLISWTTAPKRPEGLGNSNSETMSESTIYSQTPNATNSQNTTNALFFTYNPTKAFDFDGDGKADLGRFQKSTGEWRVKNSSNGAIVNTSFGTLTSKIVPADYDGDGKTDYAIFDNGSWTIKKSATNTIVTQTLGIAGDKPAVGNYDADNLADLAVYRNGSWIVKLSTTGAITTTAFGNSTDTPVGGDYVFSIF
jgi:hypothetical protein